MACVHVFMCFQQIVNECTFFLISSSVLFTVVCFRYYIKILKRGVNVAKKKVYTNDVKNYDK